MNRNFKLYTTLFTSTFQISTFTFGGGYVIIPLMKKKFSDELKWIDEEEMLNFVAIAQSSPGPIAVNASLLIGYKIGGVTGALITILGTVLPPFIIISVISYFYAAFKSIPLAAAILKSMQAGVAAVIVDVVINMSRAVIKTKQVISILIMLSSFIAVYFIGINVAYIILACVVIGALKALIDIKRKTGDKNDV